MSTKRIDRFTLNVDSLVHSEENGYYSDRLITDTFDQINRQFHPAAKLVAEAGSNLLRSLDDLSKSCEEYTEALQVLIDSGQNCCLLTKQQIHEIRETTNFMRNLLQLHRENTKKFGHYVILINHCNKWDKVHLNDAQSDYKEREKQTRKKLKKQRKNGNQDTELQGFYELQNFYEFELYQVTFRQQERYKFFVDKNNEWLLGYIGMAQQLNHMFHVIMGISGGKHETMEKTLMIEDAGTRVTTTRQRHQSENDIVSDQLTNTNGFIHNMRNSNSTAVMSERSPSDEVNEVKGESASTEAEKITKPRSIWETKAYQHVIDELIDNDFRSTPAVTSAFGTSDYGKTLVCTEKFEPHSPNQLDLSPGDRVELIRSGSKGWILAKDRETGRVGWLPSKKVELVVRPFGNAST